MYEIQWDGETRYLDGGNPYEPCMALVREKAASGEALPSECFVVKALHADKPEQQIELGTILQLLHMDNQFPEEYDEDLLT